MSSQSPKQALFAQFAACRENLGTRPSSRTVGAARPRRAQRRGSGPEDGSVDRQRLAASPAHAARRHGDGSGATASSSITGLPTTPFSTCWRRCAGSPSATWPRSNGSCAAIFMIATPWKPSLAKNCWSELRAGTVTVLDVRPEDEFALGHLPGAMNIPLRALEARLAELDPSQEIVAYCRGPYCVLSYEAVAALRAKGFKVRRLQDGLPEWRAAGLPVVASHA